MAGEDARASGADTTPIEARKGYPRALPRISPRDSSCSRAGMVSERAAQPVTTWPTPDTSAASPPCHARSLPSWSPIIPGVGVILWF